MGINDLYGSLRVLGQGDNDSYTGFSVVHSGTGIADFIVRSGGKIGMGTSLPDWDLELFRDGASSEAAIVSDGGDAILNFQTRNETDSYIVHRKGDIGVGNAIWAAGVDFSNGTGSYNTYTIATGTTFAQDHQLVITSGGTVGIRKLAPLATLDIAGDLMVRDVAVGGDYNLIWDSTTNSVKRGNDIIPVNLTGATFLVSGYTTGCTTFLVYSSNTGHQTFSANTCEDFGPYRYGKALQSIEPKLGANQANAKYSVIGGGRHNIVMSGINSEDNVMQAMLSGGSSFEDIMSAPGAESIVDSGYNIYKPDRTGDNYPVEDVSMEEMVSMPNNNNKAFMASGKMDNNFNFSDMMKAGMMRRPSGEAEESVSIEEKLRGTDTRGYAEGGIMETEQSEMLDLGGMEKDYREEGGFVPIGEYEKKDDVPARLSVNEFVFTADAVRGAGDGDVDKGAERLQGIMKQLEQQGRPEGMEMLDVSERLSEVV